MHNFFYKLDNFIYCMIRIWFEPLIITFCDVISWWNKRLKCFRWNISGGRHQDLLTSQVECTKKHNSIDGENKSVNWNAGHQNHLTVCSTCYYYTVKKRFGLNRVFWHEALVWWFESIGGAQQSFCWFFREMKSIFLLSNWRKGCWKPKASYNSVLAGS